MQQTVIQNISFLIQGIVVRQDVYLLAIHAVAGQTSNVTVCIIVVGGLIGGTPHHLRALQPVQLIVNEAARLRAESLGREIGEIRGHLSYVAVVQVPSYQAARRHRLVERRVPTDWVVVILIVLQRVAVDVPLDVIFPVSAHITACGVRIHALGPSLQRISVVHTLQRVA